MQKQPGCCPPGSWPALQVDYHSHGKKFQLADTTVYTVGQGKRVLVIVSDIFGSTSCRHQSVADTYAKFGYTVYLPQLLQKPYVGDLQMGPIVQNIKNQNWQVIQNRFNSLVDYLSEKGIKRFFVVGFCWGVWTAFQFATKYEQIISIVGMHPSLGVAGLFGGNHIELTKSLKCPAYLCPAVNDPDDIRPNGQVIKILQDKYGKDKVGSTDFPQMQHGWVVRGDVNIENVKRDVQKAIQISKKYFQKFEG